MSAGEKEAESQGRIKAMRRTLVESPKRSRSGHWVPPDVSAVAVEGAAKSSAGRRCGIVPRSGDAAQPHSLEPDEFGAICQERLVEIASTRPACAQTRPRLNRIYQII